MEALATYTNTEDGMESYVHTCTAKTGGFNVVLKDLDSGEYVPFGRIGIQSLQAAMDYAKKIAGVIK